MTGLLILYKALLVHTSFSAEKGICVPPPNFDWFDLIEYYAFRVVLLISFLYTLYQVLKRNEIIPAFRG